MSESIEWRQEGPVVTVVLNRPQSHNAMTPAMIAALTQRFQEIDEREDVRVVVLTGAGRSFCAGADLEAMRATADYSFAQNVADAEAIFDLLMAVDSCRRPVVARVNGAAIGGGAGLISACDIAVAADRAVFAFSEVRLGILPAVISPFVLARITPVYGRELFLTGERFDAIYARHIGLVHYIVPEQELDAAVAERVSRLLQAAPAAQMAAKQLIRQVAHRPKAAVRAETAQMIAERRASAEGREGMSAFLEKREPQWRSD